MKNSKIRFLPLFLLLFAVVVSGCSYSSYPPRPYYGNAYGYGYGYARPPRVVVVRPAPRVVYRNTPPRYQPNARQRYEPSRGNGARSNRNYRGNSNSSRSRSYGPR